MRRRVRRVAVQRLAEVAPVGGPERGRAMIWLVIVLGLLVAAFGATAGAALITVSRAELTRAVGRRLRGAPPSLGWLAEVDCVAHGRLRHHVARRPHPGRGRPGAPRGVGRPRLVVVLALVAVPLVLLAAYLVPRWLTLPRAESVADWVVPVLRPWARVLGLVLPARVASRPDRPALDLARRRGGRARAPTTSW